MRNFRILVLVAMNFIVLSCLFLGAAYAYLPRAHTICARTAKNSGKGLFAIEQEVQFRSLAEPITLRERWIVENGENMRLFVSSPKSAKEAFKYDIVYHDGKKVAPDASGTLQTTGVSPEFIEGFEHYRSGRGLMDALVHSRILPSAFLRPAPRPTTVASLATYKHFPEPYVRLGRSGGMVAWIFGEPSPMEGARLNPEAWIEQDAFVLQKLRFPSQAEVVADKFSSSGNLRLPRERTVTWNNNTVVIHVMSVKPVAVSANINKLLSNASLTTEDARADRLPDQIVVKEFYSRFR
jgi:hypothetical protein